ncbi:MAG: hypothetical protein ACPGU7_03555 [Gammaproteobacteria bacterium]
MFDDYVFFSPSLRDEFIAFVTREGIEYRTSGDEEELLVQVPEDLDDALCERIEAEYDRLFAAQSELTAGEEPDDIHRVGVQFTASDGAVRQARLDPELVNRLRTVMSYEELQTMVQSVADAVEDGGPRPLCKP